MIDIVLESVRFLFISVIMVIVWRAGKHQNIKRQKGWNFILAGFGLLLFGMLIDITDNFPSLNKYIVIGDTPYQAFLEKAVGYLLGFFLLAIGFWKWMPMVVKITETEILLEQHNKILGQKVQERTLELGLMNNRLNNEKELYEVTLRSIGDGVITTDNEGNVNFMNPVAEHLTDWTLQDARDQPLGKVFNIVSQSDHQLVGNPALRSLKKRRNVNLANDTILVNRKGQEYSIQDSAAPIRDQSGNVFGTVLVFTDVTETRQIAKKLLFQAKQFRQQLNYMVDASDIIVYSVGFIPNNKNSFHTIFTSSNIYRLLGYTQEQLTGKSAIWLQNIHPEDYDRVLAEFDRYFKAGTGKIDYRFRDVKGAYHWIHDCFNVVYDQNSAELLGSWRDVTHEKQTEEDRDQLEIELRLAQKLEAVGQLASGIAHEINTPIQFVGDSIHFLKTAAEDLQVLIDKYQNSFKQCSGVSAYNELLDEIKQSEEDADLEYLQEHVPKTFDRIFDGLGRVSSIVGSMKEFAHADSTEKCPGDINKALLSTIAISRNEYKYVAEIITELGEIPLVPCYIGELNQVFLNLIVNAAHAIGEVVQNSGEQGQIHIVTRQDEDAVIISVKDTGSGIPKDIRNRIFDPFFTTKEVGKGSGQGLSLAYSTIVEKHGGELTFETELGQGTTFIIRLPKGNPIHADEPSEALTI